MLSPSLQEILCQHDTFREFEPYFSITSHLFRGRAIERNRLFSLFPLLKPMSGESEIGDKIQGETIGHLNRPNLLTCTRRNREEKEIMQFAKVKSSSTCELSAFPNELDLPISRRKRVKSCTKYTLSNLLL